MLSERMNCLFPEKVRKTLVFITLFLGFAFFLICPIFNNLSIKILLIYTINISLMLFIICYKNSINKYEVGIFGFLFIQLLALMPDNSMENVDKFVSSSFLLSFRYGISSRSFIATIIDFLSGGGFVSKHFVWHFIYCTTAFLSFLISVFIGEVINNNKEDIKIFVLLLSLLCLAGFTAPSAYFMHDTFGRSEVFALLFLLFIVFFINKQFVSWFIPLFALFIFATHINLIFFYIPLVIILLLYSLYEQPDKKIKYIFLSSFTFIIISAAFILYTLFYKDTFIFNNAAEFGEHLKDKTDLFFEEGFLHFALFSTLEDHLNTWRVSVKYQGLFSVIVNIPVLLLFSAFWIRCYQKETVKMMKLFYLLPIGTLFFQSIMFFMFIDYGRWIIMMLNVQFTLIFYFIHVKNKQVISIIQSVTPFIKRHLFYVILVCCIMLFLGPVSVIGTSEKTMQIVHLIKQFLLLK
ncbi:MAG: hypothetical protein FWD28_00065 [Treponema sp.]|nr:hypothetical protein [Treponema sp.]